MSKVVGCIDVDVPERNGEDGGVWDGSEAVMGTNMDELDDNRGTCRSGGRYCGDDHYYADAIKSE